MRKESFMPVTVSEKKIKSKIKQGDRVAVIENIKYPFFEDTENEKLCKKMNFHTNQKIELQTFML